MLPNIAPSLPTRERELKLARCCWQHRSLPSLPTRERELKLKIITPALPDCVAPHAGARIETAAAQGNFGGYVVAPHAGARIETAHWLRSPNDYPVAPHAGARIETVNG